MKTLYSYKSVPEELKGSVLAIGNYDGVHRGHQIVLEKVKGIAAENGRPGGIMCFNPHPQEYFKPGSNPFYLSSLERKLALLGHFGADVAVVAPFERELAELTDEEYVSQALVDGLDVSHVVIGYNFSFGKGRTGNPAKMIEFGAKYGFEVTIISEQDDGKERYSSTRIRKLLRGGQVREAAQLLGYWWRVTGKVVKGFNKGTGLGYPTANINLMPGQDIGHGIYATYVYVEGARIPGAAYMGARPTFDNGEPVLEVFLLDFEGDLYGKTLDLEFVEFIRPDERFDSKDALVVQMDKDVAQVKAVLAKQAESVSDILSI